MNAEAFETELLAFVNGELLRGKPPVTTDDRLFEDGHLDSLRVLELVAFVEGALGRKIPDRMIRLANFRSVHAIARSFVNDTAYDADSAPLYEYHTNPQRFRSPIDELRRRGELLEGGDATELKGIARDLWRFFDDAFARWARELGADDRVAPSAIARTTLERAGFLEDFPQLYVSAGDRQGYTPAACYHRYEELAGQTLDAARVLGVRAECRRAERDPRPLERMTRFTMREVVVLGSHQDVERVRHRLVRRVDRFVTSLALDGAIEAATDPFFTSASAARALAQRAGELKAELRLTLEGGRSAAVASFNRHQQHFGRRFDIHLSDGTPAHSGCIAFGIERWVLAFLTQHGFDRVNWPEPARRALETRQLHAASR